MPVSGAGGLMPAQKKAPAVNTAGAFIFA